MTDMLCELGHTYHRGYKIKVYKKREETFWYELFKPDGSPYWAGGYIGGGYESMITGLHYYFYHIDWVLCDDVDETMNLEELMEFYEWI